MGPGYIEAVGAGLRRCAAERPDARASVKKEFALTLGFSGGLCCSALLAKLFKSLKGGNA